MKESPRKFLGSAVCLSVSRKSYENSLEKLKDRTHSATKEGRFSCSGFLQKLFSKSSKNKNCAICYCLLDQHWKSQEDNDDSEEQSNWSEYRRQTMDLAQRTLVKVTLMVSADLRISYWPRLVNCNNLKQ